VETFLGGLALAVLTGLTILAYRHPDGYKKVAWPLMWVSAVALVGTAIWNNAVTASQGRVFLYQSVWLDEEWGAFAFEDTGDVERSYVATSKMLENARESIGALHVSWRWRAVFGGVFIYASFLLWVLPLLVDSKGGREPETDSRE